MLALAPNKIGDHRESFFPETPVQERGDRPLPFLHFFKQQALRYVWTIVRIIVHIPSLLAESFHRLRMLDTAVGALNIMLSKMER
jgi:hypothetical protein